MPARPGADEAVGPARASRPLQGSGEGSNPAEVSGQPAGAAGEEGGRGEGGASGGGGRSAARDTGPGLPAPTQPAGTGDWGGQAGLPAGSRLRGRQALQAPATYPVLQFFSLCYFKRNSAC